MRMAFAVVMLAADPSVHVYRARDCRRIAFEEELISICFCVLLVWDPEKRKNAHSPSTMAAKPTSTGAV